MIEPDTKYLNINSSTSDFKDFTSIIAGVFAHNADDIDNNVIAQSNSASYRLLTKTLGTLTNFMRFARIIPLASNIKV